MRKPIVKLLAFVLLGTFLAFGQTFEEETRQEKLEYRQSRTRGLEVVPEPPRTSFEDEMRQVKRDYRAFRTAQRRYRGAVGEEVGSEGGITEAEEMKRVKRDYRIFSSQQNRQRRAVADTRP